MPILPAIRPLCDSDAFVASIPYKSKVFLIPWETVNQHGNWLKAAGYCAANCAEMVTIHSEEENRFFLNFMRNVVFDGTAPNEDKVSIWLGAQVYNKTIVRWSNGERFDYENRPKGEYNIDGLTCLTAATTTYDYWSNNYCNFEYNFFACQRSSDWTIGKK